MGEGGGPRSMVNRALVEEVEGSRGRTRGRKEGGGPWPWLFFVFETVAATGGARHARARGLARAALTCASAVRH